MIVYKNILGVWVFNDKYEVVDKLLFKAEECVEKLNDDTVENDLIKKHKARKELKKILASVLGEDIDVV